jgi:hypothetical protein
MKTSKFVSLTANVFMTCFAIVTLFVFSSCATSVSFMTSSIAPAARGEVTIKGDKNKNWVIMIEIQNLAEIERLQSASTTYVAWLLTDQEVSKNIGKLKSSGGIISRQLKASLRAVSSSKPIKIFITAEEDANVQYPGNQVILSTDRFQK